MNINDFIKVNDKYKAEIELMNKQILILQNICNDEYDELINEYITNNTLYNKILNEIGNMNDMTKFLKGRPQIDEEGKYITINYIDYVNQGNEFLILIDDYKNVDILATGNINIPNGYYDFKLEPKFKRVRYKYKEKTMRWYVDIRDSITDKYISGGSFSLEELLSWDYEGYRIEFSDENSKYIYEQHKRLYEDGVI